MNYIDLYLTILAAALTMKVIDWCIFATWWHWPSKPYDTENEDA